MNRRLAVGRGRACARPAKRRPVGRTVGRPPEQGRTAKGQAFLMVMHARCPSLAASNRINFRACRRTNPPSVRCCRRESTDSLRAALGPGRAQEAKAERPCQRELVILGPSLNPQSVGFSHPNRLRQERTTAEITCWMWWRWKSEHPPTSVLRCQHCHTIRGKLPRTSRSLRGQGFGDNPHFPHGSNTSRHHKSKVRSPASRANRLQ